MTRDTDDLGFLRTGLRQAPAADPQKKADALNRAMAAFDAQDAKTQGIPEQTRQTLRRPMSGGVLKGLSKMFETLSFRPALGATASVAALCLGVITIWPNLNAPQGLPVEARMEPAPAAAPVSQSENLRQDDAIPLSLTRKREAPSAASPLVEAAPEELFASPPVAEIATAPVSSVEVFANAPANPVRLVADDPVSTFSIDVDTASWAFVRASLQAGELPSTDAVRVEEMVNYFPYDYAPPADSGQPFQPSIAVLQTPWNPDTRLVRVALQGRMPVVENRPPINLVFLVDTSGSMDDPLKLPLLRQSLGLMLSELRPEDQVAIVAYAGSAGLVLEPTPAREQDRIVAALDALSSGGSTAGVEGLALAYKIAADMTESGEIGRVLLATDGDFNVGLSDPDGLAAYIARQRDQGLYLSVLGFGRGNLDDATMQALAQNGNGTASYIDTLQEAQKVLVDQLTGALFPIADDVKIQVEWNPALVAEYRLIGYETRALSREDFNNDKVDAGEIGAGHQMTALYEITAPDSPALLNDPLRYDTTAAATATASLDAELGFLRIRFKAPGAEDSTLIETPILDQVTTAEPDAAFAAAIAGFGQLLRGSDHLGDWGWDDAIALAQENRGADAFGYRAEAIALMRLAKSLSQ